MASGAARGGRRGILTPFEYLAVLVALAGVGMVVKRRGYHLFLAGYILFIGLVWAIGARGVLDG